MGQEKDEVYNDNEKNTTATGTDLPDAGGTVSDEDMQAISGETDDRPTGQDHSTDNPEDRMPESGVGAVQDSSTLRGDRARIEE